MAHSFEDLVAINSANRPRESIDGAVRPLRQRGTRLRAVFLVLAIGVASCAARGAPASYAERPFAVDDRHADPWIAASYRGVTPAPGFPDDARWLNVSGNASLDDLRGKVVLVDFWTYGCINCIHNLPVIKQLSDTYGDALVVVGVHSAKFPHESDPQALRSTLDRYGIAYPVVNDHDRSIMDDWGARAWPTLFLIDPAGNIAGKETGEGFERKFDRAIASLIREFDEEGALDRTPVSWVDDAPADDRSLLSYPQGIAIVEDRLYVADTGHHRILEIERTTGRVLRTFGTGEAGFADGSEPQFRTPRGMHIDQETRTLYVADSANHAVRAVDLESGDVTTVAGVGIRGHHYPPHPGKLPAVFLRSPWDVAPLGERLAVSLAGSHQIWWLDLAAGSSGYLAGTGAEGTENGASFTASLAQPSGMSLDSDGVLYFADSESSSVRRYADEEVATLAGPTDGLFSFGHRDGAAIDARFQHPTDVATFGGAVYVADSYNHAIRRIEDGAVTTTAGGVRGWRDGDAPRFDEPTALHIIDDTAYVADTNNHAVRVVDLETGSASTLLLTTETPDTVAVPRHVRSLKPISVAGEELTVSMDVLLPPDHTLQTAVPSRISATIGDSVPTTRSVGRFPVDLQLRFPATAEGGSGRTLYIDVWVAYCESDKTALCYFDQARYEVPIVDTDEVPIRRLSLTHRVTLPDT